MQTQFGKYTLLQKLGDGGMSEVFLAQISGPEGFTKQVALKRMLPHLTTDTLFTQSFINEARLGGYLNHHNIVQTLEFGQHESFYYLAMEYVRGVTLAEVLAKQKERGERIPIELGLQIAIQIAEGLAYAHTAEDAEGRPLRMIHRDLKPSNILINNHGVCKIADFGVARAESNVSQTVLAGEVKGTVSFMSPEQALGRRDLDNRSDLYSLGAILFELLTNERLYPQDSYLATLRQVQDGAISDRLPKVLELEHGIRLFQILSRVLAYNPEERYDSALALARDLREVLVHFSLDWELVDYLKALLPNSPLNVRGTSVNVPVNAGLSAVEQLSSGSRSPSGSDLSLRSARGQVSSPRLLSASEERPAPQPSPISSPRAMTSSPGRPLPPPPTYVSSPRAVTSSPGHPLPPPAHVSSPRLMTAAPEGLALSAAPPPVPPSSSPMYAARGLAEPGRPATGGAVGPAASSRSWPAEPPSPQAIPRAGVDPASVPAQEISQTMRTRSAVGRPLWARPEVWITLVVLVIGGGALAWRLSHPPKVEVPVTSIPLGALLTDASGTPLGRTPLRVHVPSSGITLQMALTGHKPQTITLDRNTPPGEVLVELEAASAALILQVSPPKAQLELDGKPLAGPPPYRQEDLTAGTHTVTATLAGYKPLTQTVVLKTGDEKKLELSLEPADGNAGPGPSIQKSSSAAPGARPQEPRPKPAGNPPDSRPRPPTHHEASSPPPPAEKPQPRAPGYLTLNAFPYARVEIDGAPVKNTPLINHPLPAGAHSIRLTTQDGRERTLQLTLEPGETRKEIVRFDTAN